MVGDVAADQSHHRDAAGDRDARRRLPYLQHHTEIRRSTANDDQSLDRWCAAHRRVHTGLAPGHPSGGNLRRSGRRGTRRRSDLVGSGAITRRVRGTGRGIDRGTDLRRWSVRTERRNADRGDHFKTIGRTGDDAGVSRRRLCGAVDRRGGAANVRGGDRVFGQSG